MEALEKTQTIVDGFLQGLNYRNADDIAALFAEDIDWYVPGNSASPCAGSYTQRPDVAAYFQAMWPAFEEVQNIVIPGNIVVAENDVVIFALFRHTVVSTGKTFQSPVAFHLVLSNGKISGLHLYESTWVVC